MDERTANRVLRAASITKLPADARGAVGVSGSHGGLYPGYLAAKAGLRAVILNDAGVGKDAAGIGALAYCEALGMAAAAVSHLSCRIGDADDMMARGVISHANRTAAGQGVGEGMPCDAAAERLTGAPPTSRDPTPVTEGRRVLGGAEGRRVVLIDSASLVAPEDAGRIVVTGSHGGLVGGAARMALQVDAFAAVFNDAGGGADGCGMTRLVALDVRGIAGLTVAHTSARIGEAASTLEDGVVSHANETARRLGAAVGLEVAELVERWRRAPVSYTP